MDNTSVIQDSTSGYEEADIKVAALASLADGSTFINFQFLSHDIYAQKPYHLRR